MSRAKRWAGMGTGRKEGSHLPYQLSMPAVKKFSDDPFEQAEYAYSLIESEVDGDGTE